MGTRFGTTFGTRFRSETPVAVAVDLDGDDVVARPPETLDDAPCGLDRDVVLARAAAEEHRDAAPRHGVVVVVVGVVGTVGVVVTFCSRPIVSVTAVFWAALVPPIGSCASTIPSSVGSVTFS